MVSIGNEWDTVLSGEFEKGYYLELRRFLIEEYRNGTVYPGMYDIFNALKYTAYDEVKSVILGQDPYHEPGQAHGLCFSVQKGVAKPPSLINIFEELKSDLGIEPPGHGCLLDWAVQGVLLLNTVLTVRRGQANSHQGKGWEIFTDKVIKLLNERDKPVIFILWGANAKAKANLLTNPRHLIITGAHPSPLSARNGFFDGKYFSRANEFLASSGEKEIDWKVK